MRIFFRFTPRKKFEFRDLPVLNIYYLFTSWEICIRENCARGLEGTVFPDTDRPRLVNNIFIFLIKLNEILSRRTRIIHGCNYSMIFHKLNNFRASKW